MYIQSAIDAFIPSYICKYRASVAIMLTWEQCMLIVHGDCVCLPISSQQPWQSWQHLECIWLNLTTNVFLYIFFYMQYMSCVCHTCYAISCWGHVWLNSFGKNFHISYFLSCLWLFSVEFCKWNTPESIVLSASNNDIMGNILVCDYACGYGFSAQD